MPRWNSKWRKKNLRKYSINNLWWTPNQMYFKTWMHHKDIANLFILIQVELRIIPKSTNWWEVEQWFINLETLQSQVNSKTPLKKQIVKMDREKSSLLLKKRNLKLNPREIMTKQDQGKTWKSKEMLQLPQQMMSKQPLVLTIKHSTRQRSSNLRNSLVLRAT